MRTSRRATESSVRVISRGEMSDTCASVPLGYSTSVGRRLTRYVEPENVSGTARRITRRRDRSLRISPPFPVNITETVGGCSSSARPGGTSTVTLRSNDWLIGCCAATATYSIRARNTAASLIGQLRVNSRVTLPAIDEPPDEGLVHRAVPLGGADDLLDEPPIAVDHEALRHAGRLIGLLDRPRTVVKDLEGQAELLGEPAHQRGIVLVDADGHEPEVGAGELPLQPLQGRHLDATGRAPGRPDVEQQDLAAIVGQGGRPAGGQVDGLELGGARADADEVDLGAQLQGEHDAEDGGRRDPRDDAPLLAGGHTVTRQRRRSSLTSRGGARLLEMALPATDVAAPAASAAPVVARLIPPSTPRNPRRPPPTSNARARWIFSFAAGRYVCPPKPGFTVITRNRSKSPTTSSASASGDPGLSSRPASRPRCRIAASCRCTWVVASGR